MQSYCELEPSPGTVPIRPGEAWENPRDSKPTTESGFGRVLFFYFLVLSTFFTALFKAVALTDLSQKDSNYASNGRQLTVPGRKNTSSTTQGAGELVTADSGTAQSWLLSAELGGPIPAAYCSNRPLKGTWRTLLTQ